ncbi:MAG: ArsA family ATPase [Oligoflexia bacterium]|nr:ArsA family ATPase [Oligoflexia bacterium]
MSLEQLVDARLILVTGKGGTGKSSVAAALGRLCSESGRRGIVVEVDVFQSSMPDLLGRTPEYEARPVAPGLDVCNITWQLALSEWLQRAIPVQRLVRMILRNRLVGMFLDATPGVREIVILSRIATLCEQYDQVIVDLPASGHAVALLQVPWLADDLLDDGPIHQRAGEIIALLGRSDTRLAVVALPEDMVVNETIELVEHLAQVAPVLGSPVLLLNCASSPSLSFDERTLLDRLAARVVADSPAAELVAAGRWERDLELATAESLQRLSSLGLPLVELARMGALGGFHGGPEVVVRQLARALARALTQQTGEQQQEQQQEQDGGSP